HASVEAGDRERELVAMSWLVAGAAHHRDQFDVALELAALGEAAAVHADPQPEAYMRLDAGRAKIDEDLGNLEAARAGLDKGLGFGERTHAPGSSIDGARNELAVVLVDQGKYPEAATLLEHSVDDRVRRHGPDHPWVAAVLNNL